jgi:hypothetical protein
MTRRIGFEVVLLVFVLVCSEVAIAASYKCQDASGKWTEQACPDYQARQKHAADEAAAEVAFRNWHPKIGMTEEEVLRVVDSKDCRAIQESIPWCSCRHVNKTQNVRGVHEQWVFGCDTPYAYLYFDNGVLTSIQK